MAGQETELHQAPGDIFGKIQTIDDARLTFFKFGECPGRGRGNLRTSEFPVDTHLHHGISICASDRARQVPTLLVLDKASPIL